MSYWEVNKKMWDYTTLLNSFMEGWHVFQI